MRVERSAGVSGDGLSRRKRERKNREDKIKTGDTQWSDAQLTACSLRQDSCALPPCTLPCYHRLHSLCTAPVSSAGRSQGLVVSCLHTQITFSCILCHRLLSLTRRVCCRCMHFQCPLTSLRLLVWHCAPFARLQLLQFLLRHLPKLGTAELQEISFRSDLNLPKQVICSVFLRNTEPRHRHTQTRRLATSSQCLHSTGLI